MKIKTAELIGRQLDYAVALSAGGTGFRYDTIASYWITIDGKHYVLSNGWSEDQCYTPSTNWLRGGPIIERESISICTQMTNKDWMAVSFHGDIDGFGPPPLIAAMRCYCCAKLGDEIDIPEELQPCQQPNL